MQRVLVNELFRGVEREKYRTKGNDSDVAGEGKGARMLGSGQR